jgi:hypothetical protein
MRRSFFRILVDLRVFSCDSPLLKQWTSTSAALSSNGLSQEAATLGSEQIVSIMVPAKPKDTIAQFMRQVD